MFAGIHRLRRSQALEILRQIERAPFASPDEVRENQWRRLEALIAHAEQRVPYYRELFRALGLSSRDIRTPDDFSRLPILTKDIIRERWRDLIREDVPLDRLHRHHSGGSTGVPLTFFRERAYMDASDAGTYRNFLQCGWRLGEMVAFFWGSNERLQRMSRAEFELRQMARRMYQFDPFHSGSEEMDGWLRRWPRLGATIAFGYASTLARFAEFIESAGRRVRRSRAYSRPRKSCIRSSGRSSRACSDAASTTCMAAAKSRTSPPSVRTAACTSTPTYVVVETDRAAAPGVAPPLILTSLWNYGMPFIRYRNEDCAKLIAERCGCGNNFPLMTLDVARVSDNFVLPGGRVVHGEFFTHLMYGSEGIRTFQFHQTAPDRITLWVVPDGARGGVGAGARARRRGPPDPGAQRRAAVDRRAGNRSHSVEPRRQTPIYTFGRGALSSARVREPGNKAAAEPGKQSRLKTKLCAGFAVRIVPAGRRRRSLGRRGR